MNATTPTPQSVIAIARAALTEAAGIAPDRVPDALVQAIATGRGNRPQVAVMAHSLGPDVGLDLIRFDTDRIASFVFESSRPPVLAGASRILRELNAGIASDPQLGKWTLFSGGGEGLLLAPRGCGEKICREIEERYRRESVGALGVTTATISIAPEDFLEEKGIETVAKAGVRVVSGTSGLLARLHDAIGRKKDERLPPRGSVAGNRARCRSCRDRTEGTTTLASLGRTDEAGAICEPCAKRWREGRDLIAGLSFEDLIDHWTGARPEGSRKESYLGFLYADGNGMGALFGKLTSLEEMQTLSCALTSCFERLRERVLDEVRKTLPPNVRGREEKLVLDLLAGGDEIVWILPAALAVHVAERIAPWLDEAVAERPALVELLKRHGRRGLSVGIGLALCGLGYPVRYQYQLAKALQKQAKHRVYEAEGGIEESVIDFELLTDSSPLSEDLKALRKLVAGTEEPNFFRTCRPYRCADLTALRRHLELALESGLALSQLYGLSAGSQEGRRPFLNLLRYQIARKPAAESYERWLARCKVDVADPQAIERFFVRESGDSGALWIDDALDLLPFLEGVRGRLAEGRA